MGDQANWLKNQRLRRPEEFKRVFDQGLWGVSPCVRLVIARSPRDEARYGFAISKRFGKAVQRNVIRRRMREILRLNAKSLPVGFDCVVLPSQKNSKPGYDELAKVLPELIRQTLRRLEKQERRELQRSNKAAGEAKSEPALVDPAVNSGGELKTDSSGVSR